jgi:5-formyltetrahydrofolate cyclo-ligase
MKMLKKEARKLFRQKRSLVTPEEKTKLDDLLLIEFQKLPLPFISVLLSFYPVEENNEPHTFSISGYLQFKNPGLQIAYPKIDLTDHSMQAIICGDDDVFEKNSFMVPEPQHCETINPQEIDLVLVPLLAFDNKGFRVGYGKGFYDRFLQQCKNDCIKIGLSYFEPIDAIDDADEFDVPLNFCITPQKFYVF